MSEPKAGGPMCAAKTGSGWHMYPCGRKAKRDGWCGIHHPDAAKARQEKYSKRYNAEREAARQERNNQARAIIRKYLNACGPLEIFGALDTWEHEPQRKS